MIKIRCVVERITYQNPENGYSVLKCAVKNNNDLVTVVGNLVDANVGSVLLIDGNWKVDAKYGRQFLAESWEETMPATVFGIEKFMVPQFAPGEVVPEDAAKEIEKECIYLPPFYFAEIGVANKLKNLAAEPAADRLWVSLMKARQDTGNPKLSVNVDKIQKAVNMKYDEVQAEAIRRAATAKVLVLTGGPGTGKTTTTQGIIAAYRAFGLNILLAAPTGRTAKRMTEAAGLEAKTIHRLLEFKPPEGYQKNEETPLEGDVLIVDECSMIDIVLMNALMKAIPPQMRLILVGERQLIQST